MKCSEWKLRPVKEPWWHSREETKRCECRGTFYDATVSTSRTGPYKGHAGVSNRRGRSEEAGSFATAAEARAQADEWLANLCQYGSPQKLTKFKYHTKRGEFRGGCGCGGSRGR